MQIITSIFFEIFLDQHTDELVCKQRRVKTSFTVWISLSLFFTIAGTTQGE